MGDELLDNESEGLSCLLGELSDHIGTYGLTKDTTSQLRSMLGFTDYTGHRGRGVEGNDVAGNGSQINFNLMLRVIRMAHKDKIDTLRQLLSDTHWSHDAPQFSYHHHRRGQVIECLGVEIKDISLMLWVLQCMNGNTTRIKNFHWVFDTVVEDDSQ